MISFKNIDKKKPFARIEDLYKEALIANQKNIEAICISSYSIKNGVNSRFVNLKIVDDDKLFFFTNYESEKAYEFDENNQISAVLYWNQTNTQIRMKSHILKTSNEFNQNYFLKRTKEKNALAISSKQSKKIDSFQSVKKNFFDVMQGDDLTICPEYWGGYCFSPFYIEFWTGDKYRLNKREVFELCEGKWKKYFLQP